MLSKTQIEMMAHAIGLNHRSRKPFRNYYNTGSCRNEDWDDLIKKGLAFLNQKDLDMGGNYYHLTSRGLAFVLNNPKTFDMDKRIKKLTTVIKMAN